MRHFLFLVLIILAEVIYCQEPFPLKLGNSWATRDFFFRPNRKVTVVDSNIIIDNKKYNEIYSLHMNMPFTYYSRLREDGYYVSFDSVNFFERIYFKENPNIGDLWINSFFEGDIYYTITDTSYYLLFGRSTKIFIVSVTDSILNYNEQYWSVDFGLIQYTVEDPFAGNLYWLSGCVIDGVVYGDTSLNPVSVDDNGPPPKEYLLKQNYPNPFNPSTKIKYSLKDDGKVSLKIFNSLGEEVRTLVNEIKTAGNYEVEFNASELPSGVYIYSMQSGSFVSSKKMILLK